MIKLELKHLAPYLPYKLKVVEWYLGKQIHDEFIVDCVNWDGENIGGSDATLDSFELERTFNLRDIKPILRPLSSMTKKEAKELMSIVISDDKIKNISIKNEDSLVTVLSQKEYGLYVLLIDSKDGSIEAYYEDYSCISPNYPVCYELYEWLFAHHFDVFNLVDKNLAIDKTKL